MVLGPVWCLGLTLWTVLLRTIWLFGAIWWSFGRILSGIFARVFARVFCHWSLLTSRPTTVLVNGPITLLITRWFIWIITGWTSATSGAWSSSRTVRANISLTTSSDSNCCTIGKWIYKWTVINIFSATIFPTFIIIGWIRVPWTAFEKMKAFDPGKDG